MFALARAHILAVVAVAVAVVAGASSAGCEGRVVGDDPAPPPPPPTPTLATAEKLADLGAVPCIDEPGFTCLSLPVPLAHDDPGGPTIDVLFAILPAAAVNGPRLGMLVTVQGGPGYSGVYYAEDWTEVDPAIADQFDLVFFDLRGFHGLSPAPVGGGAGELRGTQCTDAADAFYDGGLRASNEDEDDAMLAKASAFARDCVDETGVDEATLAHIETSEAIEDLEDFRAALGEEQLNVYGLSYGTQLTQLYVQAHPDRVRTVILDGVVDLTRLDVDFATDLARADNDVLARTLTLCADDDACAASFAGVDPAAAFDAFAASLPRTFRFGVTQTRTFTRSDLDTVAIAAVDNPEYRALFLDALAAASADDDVAALADLCYFLDSVDPDTLETYADDTWSDAGYYTVTCNDYGRTDADDWIARGVALRGDPSQRLLASFYGDLPCASWPTAPELQALPPRFVPAAPTLFINADADVATPFDQGDGMSAALLQEQAPVSRVTVNGGHHVMLGVGNACVDAAFDAFLFHPADNLGRDTRCDDALVAVE